jgi:hypothetical protein
VTSPSGTRHRGGRCRGTTAVAGTVDAHPHLTLPGGAHGIDRAADPTPRLLDVAEDNARLLGQAGVRRGPEGGRAGPGRPGLSLTMRERWRGRPGSPYARAAGGWLARTGSLPAGLPVEVNTGHGDRPQPAAARAASPPGSTPWSTGSGWRPTWPGSWPPRDGAGGDPGRAGVLEQLRGDHPAAPACLGRRAGGAGRAAGGGPCVGPARPCRGGAGWRRDRLRRRLAAAQPAPPGRSRRWSPPGWSPVTPWPRPPSTAGGCWASPAPASSPRGPADILLGHGDPLTDPGSRWRV